MQNKTTTVNRGVAILLVIMLLFNGIMPMQVSANTGDGWGGSPTKGTGSAGSTGKYSVYWQGLRVYLVDRSGTLVSNIADITTEDPDIIMTGSTVVRGRTTKDGQNKGYAVHDQRYEAHFTSIDGNVMPTPYTSPNIYSSVFTPRGTDIDDWFEAENSSGFTNLQDWLDLMDVFGLREADREPSDVVFEEDLIFVYEPITWLALSDENYWYTDCWFYGTPTDLGYALESDNDFWKSAVGVKLAFPRSIYLREDLPVDGGKYNVYTGSEGVITRSSPSWRVAEFSPDTNGYGIGWQQPNAGGTSTWDDPDLTIPGPAPDEADDEGITIVKNYVKGNEETHVETFYRGETLKQILIENEPDVDTGYELIAYYDSEKDGPTPAGTEDWASLLGTVPPIELTSTSEYDSSSENFYVEAAGGTSLGNQTVTLAEGSNTLVVKLRKMDGDFTYTDDPYIFIYL